MKNIIRITIFIAITLSFTIQLFAQEKDYFGEYRPAVQKAITYLQLIEQKKTSELKKDFTPTDFQKKKDFQHTISNENIKWSSQLIKKYGVPGDDQTAISVWTVGGRNSDDGSASVNVSFYFKDPTQPLSLVNDRICINLTSLGGKYLIDGILFFRKSDYDAMEKLIQDMP